MMKNLYVCILFMLLIVVKLDADFTMPNDGTVFLINKTAGKVSVVVWYGGGNQPPTNSTDVDAGTTGAIKFPKGNILQIEVKYGDPQTIKFVPTFYSDRIYIYGDTDIKNLSLYSDKSGLDMNNQPASGPARYVALWKGPIDVVADPTAALAIADPNINSLCTIYAIDTNLTTINF